MKPSHSLMKGLRWQDQEFDIPREHKSLCVTRYGGIGDMVQMSSVLPHLKNQGWHITLNTVGRVVDVVREDPFIDAFFLQDDGQVPIHEIEAYWSKLAGYFDHYINLSESVEGSMIAIHGRPDFYLSHEERNEKFSGNYLENIHRMAGVPQEYHPKFYPTPHEDLRARETVKRYGKNVFLVMVSLSGSSVHKAWPHTDQAMFNALAKYRNIRFILVGDPLCQMLEAGWEREARVICKSGKMKIRDVLSLAPHMDMVIGTETGILNSVGHLPVPKAVILSHSSQENLTKHWKNAHVFEPENTPCYPCHRMHYSFQYCNRSGDTGASLCASNVDPGRVSDIIDLLYQQKFREYSYEQLPVAGSGSRQ